MYENRAMTTVSRMVDFWEIESQALRSVTDEALPVIFGVTNPDYEYVIVDLVDMPHLLVAGTTGSGKSVMLHSIISSLLTWATEDDVSLVLMDFKRVEFTPYRDIPHLLLPIIKETQDAKMALDWLVGEMERRFRLLEKHDAIDISDISSDARIVVVIDELADLILQDKTVEIPIVRLAQMGRAAGIHLILSTQRPTTNVVTGLIKANVPSRLAFAVASEMESRIILDQGGAEELMGRGDFLFRQVGKRGLVHGQGAFISREDIKRLTSGYESDGPIVSDPSVLPTHMDGERGT